jgi:Homing endonuclease associated repeat
MTREEIIAAIKACTEKLGRTPTCLEVCKATEGKLDKATIFRKFGKYTHALAQCGLERSDIWRPRSEMEHFTNWANLARKLNNLPSYTEYQAHMGASHKALHRRYKTWGQVPTGMLKFIEREKLEGEWGDVAEMIRQHGEKCASRRPRVTPLVKPSNVPSVPEPMAPPTATQATLPPGETCPAVMQGRPVYGHLISHPAMSHAPTNEMGVMLLFGALALDLGFVIMRTQAAFPDCEAMRRMANGRLQVVLIEFEYDSRNFLEHMHDIKGCDLIVCWKHGWKSCPVEVIELSKFFSS